MSWIADFNRQWTLLMQLSVAAWGAFVIRPRLGWPAALCLWWFAAGGIAVFQNSFGTYDHLITEGKEWLLLQLQAYSQDSVVKLVIVVAGMMWLSSRSWRFEFWGRRLALAAVLVNSAAILAQFAFSGSACRTNECGGIFGNPSMSGCLTLVMLPVCLTVIGGWTAAAVCVISAAAAFATRASVPLGILAAMLLVYGLSASGRRTRLVLLTLTPLCLFAGLLLLDKELFNSSDRLEIWGFFFEKYKDKANWVLGMGIGTWGPYMMDLQRTFDVKTNNGWLWPHSDFPIGIIVEGGAVGALLFLATYTSALWRLIVRGRWHEAVSLVLYALMMPLNYPLHLATTVIYGCWLVIIALDRGGRHG